MFNRRNTGGFTLTELMIVVVIIGILTVLAIPRFIAVPARFEAKSMLKRIAVEEQLHLQQEGCYVADLNELDICIPADGLCSYSIKVGTDSSTLLPTFIAKATSDDLDEYWTIDQWHRLKRHYL